MHRTPLLLVVPLLAPLAAATGAFEHDGTIHPGVEAGISDGYVFWPNPGHIEFLVTWDDPTQKLALDITPFVGVGPAGGGHGCPLVADPLNDDPGYVDACMEEYCGSRHFVGQGLIQASWDLDQAVQFRSWVQPALVTKPTPYHIRISVNDEAPVMDEFETGPYLFASHSALKCDLGLY